MLSNKSLVTVMLFGEGSATRTTEIALRLPGNLE